MTNTGFLENPNKESAILKSGFRLLLRESANLSLLPELGLDCLDIFYGC